MKKKLDKKLSEMVFHVLAPDNGQVISWNKRLKGRFLRPGSILGEFKTSDGAKKKIKSVEPGGFLEKILAEVEENLLSNRQWVKSFIMNISVFI